MGPVSERSAVGIIIAHANPGQALLSTNIGIWVSRDGGYSWKKHAEVLYFGCIIETSCKECNITGLSCQSLTSA